MSKSKLLIRIYISDTLYTTVPYDKCHWDETNIYIDLGDGRKKIYKRREIKSFMIFSADPAA